MHPLGTDAAARRTRDPSALRFARPRCGPCPHDGSRSPAGDRILSELAGDSAE
jgi:hypothetical protein